MLSPADRKALIEQHVGYVRALASKEKGRLGRGIELDELVAYGSKGLVEAAERFDPSRGGSFATFSYYRIRGAIFDGLREMGWLSRTEYARYKAEERANSYCESVSESQTGAADKPASLDEAVADLQKTVAGITTIFVTSLEGQQERAGSIADGKATAEERLGDHELQGRLREAVSKLPDKERILLEHYYFRDCKLEEAGAVLGLSKSWASRLHARAIDLLRVELEQHA